MAQHHRTGSSGFVITQFQPTQESSGTVDHVRPDFCRRGRTTEVSIIEVLAASSSRSPDSCRYAGARNGLNFRSALAAKTKSLSVRPLILCDQISILHLPQARYRSG